MKKNNLKLIAAIVILSLMGISTQSFSQDHCYFDNWTNEAGIQWWNSNIPSEYALTTEQISRINDIRAKSNKKILPLQNELRTIRSGYDGNYSKMDAGSREMKSYRKKVRALEDKISGQNLEAKSQIEKILSKDQLSYFNDGGYGWWDMDDDCWHSNPNEMRYGNERMTYNRGCCY